MLHITKIKPLFTSIVTTGDKFEKDFTEGGIIIANKGDLKLWQKVLYTGSSVRDIKPGDMVMINANNYIVRKYDKNSLQNDLDNNPKVRYNFKWVTLDDEKGNPSECLLLNDRDIEYIFEGEEKDEPVLDIPSKKLIIPQA